MTNLDIMFKSRDITLPTKVHLVKAMVYPVVMYGCESWTVKKAECQRIDAFGQTLMVPDSPLFLDGPTPSTLRLLSVGKNLVTSGSL